MNAQRSGARILAAALVAAALAGLCSTAQANVYPASLSIADDDISQQTELLRVAYVLNENADGDGVNPGVKFEVLNASDVVVRTISVAYQARGKYVFEWDGRNDAGNIAPAGDYRVRITAADFGYVNWVQISDDAEVAMQYNSPRGVAVNTNPDSPFYGRVYVTNSATGTKGNGMYVLDADRTEAVPGLRTGGLFWPASASGPWKIEVGDDDNPYIGDWTDSDGGVMRAGPNILDAPDLVTGEIAGEIVLSTRGQNNVHGSITGSPIAKGSLATGDLTIYAVDEDLVPFTTLWRWPIGAGPLPYNTPPVVVSSLAIPVNGVLADADIGTGGGALGKIYLTQRRSNGTETGLWVLTPDGATTLWDSLAETRTLLDDPSAVDLLRETWAVKVSTDGSMIAAIKLTSETMIIPLDANGIPILASNFVLPTGTIANGRDVAWDAANNLYVATSGHGQLRIWSPPDGAHSNQTTSAVFALNKAAGGPTINTQPTDLQRCPTQSATFTVAATGATTFQWKRNGVDLVDGGNVSGANTASLTISNLTNADDGGVYTVAVSDANGVRLSNPAQLTVGASFAKPPVSSLFCANTDATFEVIARGVGALSYQWKKQVGEDPPVNVGTNSPMLTLPNVQVVDNGALITVDVTDSCGAVTSPAAVLTVRAGPVLSAFSGPKAAAVGGTATFSIGAIGQGPVHYQWKKMRTDNTVELVGTDSPFVAVTNLRCEDDGAIVFCEVTDDCGTTTSAMTGVLTITGVAEICGNGIDDDCNGLADCDDPICQQIDPTCMVCNEPFADVEGGAEPGEGDGDVDSADFAVMQRCITDGAAIDEGCECLDRDQDGDIDGDDIAQFVACGSGPEVPADASCDDYESGNVVINEFVYDIYTGLGGDLAPDNLEFVELYNADTVPVDISGWILRASDVFPGDDNRDLVVPGGPATGTVVLAPGEFYVFTAENVPVPGGVAHQIVDPDEDIWENGPDALELLDGNRNVVDTVIYDRATAGTVDAPGEGYIFGDYLTVETTLLSASRYLDGLDTNNNGRDFGMRPWTPGTSNHAGAPIITSFVPPNVDGQPSGDAVAGFQGSFVSALVINPASARDPDNAGDTNPNPNVIAASPQGGNAIIAWDPAGGGNMVATDALFQNGAAYDLYVYLDTTPYGEGGAESATYGILGSTDTLYQLPDPNDVLYGDIVRPNGNTGVGWVFEKEDSANLIRITLCDFGAGGDSSGGPGSQTPRSWTIVQSIDLTGVPSGWHRLKLSYNAGSGAVHAEFDAQTFDFVTQPGLVGTFYIGYRETLAGVPFAKLRPPTFDLVP